MQPCRCGGGAGERGARAGHFLECVYYPHPQHLNYVASKNVETQGTVLAELLKFVGHLSGKLAPNFTLKLDRVNSTTQGQSSGQFYNLKGVGVSRV